MYYILFDEQINYLLKVSGLQCLSLLINSLGTSSAQLGRLAA